MSLQNVKDNINKGKILLKLGKRKHVQNYVSNLMYISKMYFE